MKVKSRRCLMVFLMALGMLLSAMTASAYQEQGTEEAVPIEEGASAEVPVIEETQVTDSVITERTAGESADGGEEPSAGVEPVTAGTPFSIPGNGLLLDDKSADGTKQFLTIRTKNGNTFFLVLDRSNHTENVYMLSMIDENDLTEFLEDAQEQPKTQIPSLAIPQKDTESMDSGQTEKPEQTKKEQEKSEPEGMNTGGVLVFILILMGGIGGFYYLKVLRPKRAEEDAEVEDLEFCDDGIYINEGAEEEEE